MPSPNYHPKNNPLKDGLVKRLRLFGNCALLAHFSKIRYLQFDRTKGFRMAFYERLVPLSVILAFAFTGLAVSHPFFVESMESALFLSCSAGLSMLVCLAVTIGACRSIFPESWAYSIGTLLSVISYLNAAIHLFLTADPIHSTNFFVVMVATGAAFNSLRWWSLNIALGWFLWAAAGPMAYPESTWGSLHNPQKVAI